MKQYIFTADEQAIIRDALVEHYQEIRNIAKKEYTQKVNALKIQFQDDVRLSR